jgi:type IV pilus assembly protein PilA
MLHRLRQRTENEGGFTLIELLVVVLIIGILSAIAIPAFLSQTSKASDSAAKTQVGTLQTTMQSFAAENNGSYVYSGTSPATLQAKLEEIEPTLKDTSTAKVVKVVGSATGYEVESESVGTKDTYLLTSTSGTLSRTCKVANAGSPGGCKNLSGTKGSW